MDGKYKFGSSNEEAGRFLDDFQTKVIDFFTGDEKLRYRIQYCMLEIINNAVEHGNRSDQRMLVTVDWQIDDRTLEISVTDEGSGFSSEVPAVLPPLSQPRGRGLYSVKQYTNSLRIEGNKLTILFKREEE